MEYNYEKEFIDSFTYCDYFKYMDAIKNSKLLGFVRRSALAVLFPNGIIYNENYLLPRIRTLFNAFKYDKLFMMSNFSYAKEIVEDLYVISNSFNPDDVRQSFFNLFNKKINYQKLLDNLFDCIEEKYKYDYANKFAKKFYPQEKFVDKNGREYNNVVDITNEDFYLFIHNISVGFADDYNANRVTLRPELFIDEHCGRSSTISGAVITKDFIGYASSRGAEIIYGFDNFTKDDVIVIGNKDLNVTHNFSYERYIPEYNLQSLYSTDSLSKNMINYYGEGVVWRKAQGKKRKPDYILCFDEITDEALRHAEFYDIPIYFIDRMMCYKNQAKRLKEEFENLKNDDAKSLDKIEDYLLHLISFHWSISLMEYDFDFTNEDIKIFIRNLDELYRESGEFIEDYLFELKLRDDFSKNNKIECVVIDNLFKRNNGTSSAMKIFVDKMERVGHSEYFN